MESILKKKFKFNFIITGACGFIGFHVSLKLLDIYKDSLVIGIDNLNNYYDVKLKKSRLKILKQNKNFLFKKIDINNINKINFNISKRKNILIHLAAQAGVRYSFSNPNSYIKSNLSGFFEILEFARKINIYHLISASTSSVYGDTKKFPLVESSNTDNPITLYAATKKSNEVIGHSYSSMFNIPITILRFFTVYGPYGRPDMALFKFVKNIFENKKSIIHNYGKHSRDFTYINDVVNYLIKIIESPPNKKIPFEIYNVCGANPKTLKNFIKTIENISNKKISKNYTSFQAGDVLKTFGSNKKIEAKTKYKPQTNLHQGIGEFIKWYKKFNNIT